MDFTALKAELAARGYDYLTAARQGSFINQAYTELCQAADWPFLETTASGSAPLTISDLRSVLYVHDTTNRRPLVFKDIRSSGEDRGTDLSTSGSPEHYWLDGLTSVKVLPPNTSVTLSVRYVKRHTVLSAGADTPLFNSEHHDTIVDIAEALAAARDESNDKDLTIVRSEVDRAVAQLVPVYMARSQDSPRVVQAYGSTDW